MFRSPTSRRQTCSAAWKTFERVVMDSARPASRLTVPLPASARAFPGQPALKARPDLRSRRRFQRIVGAFLLQALANSRMSVQPTAPVALIFEPEESPSALTIG